MPILAKCKNCGREGGYARSAEADYCLRCDKELGEPTRDTRGRFKPKESEENEE